MSRPITETITCPRCGKAGPFTRWSFLNVTLDPDKKQKLLDGSLTRFVCGCGHSADVVYPLLYHDMRQGILIWMLPSPDGDQPAAAPEGVPRASFARLGTEYRVRAVATHNELSEKIRIFDESMDDRLIELAKLLAESKLSRQPSSGQSRLFYDRTEGEGDKAMLALAVVSESGVSGVSLSRDAMFRTLKESFGTQLAAPPAGEWPCVDRRYALSMMAAASSDRPKSGPVPPAPASPPVRPAKKPWWKFGR